MSSKRKHTMPYKHSISYKDREVMNNHKSFIVWFTGLSASGKSTLASSLEVVLHKKNMRTYVLDGDNIRQGLCKDLGFSNEDREENIRRIGEVSKLMTDAGVIVLTAFISPFVKDRQIARGLFNEGKFIEVYCNAPIEVCESRDPKGLYKKARSGGIPNFTGISSPYEQPTNSEITLDTDKHSVNECIDDLIYYMKNQNLI